MCVCVRVCVRAAVVVAAVVVVIVFVVVATVANTVKHEARRYKPRHSVSQWVVFAICTHDDTAVNDAATKLAQR